MQAGVKKMITLQQKIVLVIGGILVIVMLLFPPMRAKSQHYFRSGKVIKTEFVGHQPLLIKNAVADAEIIETWIDFPILSIQIVILALLLSPFYFWKFNLESAKIEEKAENATAAWSIIGCFRAIKYTITDMQLPAWLLPVILIGLPLVWGLLESFGIL